MKKWIMKIVDDDYALVLAVVNLVLVLVVALVVKAFNGNVSVFAGCGFVAGCVATVFQWVFCSKVSENAPFGAVIGTMLGAVFAYLLGC